MYRIGIIQQFSHPTPHPPPPPKKKTKKKSTVALDIYGLKMYLYMHGIIWNRQFFLFNFVKTPFDLVQCKWRNWHLCDACQVNIHPSLTIIDLLTVYKHGRLMHISKTRPTPSGVSPAARMIHIKQLAGNGIKFMSMQTLTRDVDAAAVATVTRNSDAYSLASAMQARPKIR